LDFFSNLIGGVMSFYICLGLIALVSFAMLAARRLSILVILFALQSAVLFLISGLEAYETGEGRLYTIALMVLLVKVIGIPFMLRRTIRDLHVKDELGMFIKPFFSVLSGVLLVTLAAAFVGWYLPFKGGSAISISIALSIMLSGMFLMIFRMQALAQVVGLLVMENGIFLAGASLAGAVPFFVEIAVAFDVFMVVVILGVFIYRINSLFTHIDVNKLTKLKG